MKKIYIDLETTGRDPVKSGVIQIAGIIEAGYGVPEVEFDFEVRPFHGDVIEEKAMEVNGKSVLEVMAYPIAKGVHKQFTAMLGKYVKRTDPKDKFLLVGYNAHFDANFLREWFYKCGDKYFGSYFFTPPIDLMAVAGWVLQDERKNFDKFSLSSVAAYLGLPVPEDLHDAMADIRLTKSIEEALTEKLTLSLVPVDG